MSVSISLLEQCEGFIRYARCPALLTNMDSLLEDASMLETPGQDTYSRYQQSLFP